ncbi:MAG: hypothetical protein CVV41_02910 [Candidatus Riflebacteria bacterium HGW-Riflebacteria-1]|jgi:hypothetical protein|nr:MAG: hypothetical protein CVV41_02910 [Candidatus Riflebacteria bacterium HGW-Riflebacteria-1]
MANTNSIPQNWHETLTGSLKSERSEEKLIALDFLCQQNSISLEFAQQLMPMINESVVHHDTQVRYFARKTRNHFFDCFPEIESGAKEEKPFKLELTDGEILTTQQILLHKMRLGSRYVVFEAMERLTESGDASLATPLLEYLLKEKDEYKISYLVRVISRIDDPRIPDVLEDFLAHEDPRIVANALESLCEYNRPEIEDKLVDFATSSDNRIRANAVKGLHKYSPKLAESHIAEMVKSSNIALQDSGVYLLRTIRPSNLAELLEIAQHSRYATVRMKTLDIMPQSADERELAGLMKKEDVEAPDPRRDLFLMAFFLGLGFALLLLADPGHKQLLSLFFLIISAVTLLSHEKTRTSIQKTALSMGFVSSLAWGNTRLMVLPTLMGLWLTWNNQQINRLGKIEKAPPETVFAWFFAIGAIVIHQVTQDELSMTFGLISKLGSEGLRLPQALADMASRQSRFELAIFAMVSLMTLLIMKLNKWLPSKTPYESPNKRLFTATVVCLAILMLINLFHFWGLKFQMKISGINSTLAILQQLQP